MKETRGPRAGRPPGAAAGAVARAALAAAVILPAGCATPAGGAPPVPATVPAATGAVSRTTPTTVPTATAPRATPATPATTATDTADAGSRAGTREEPLLRQSAADVARTTGSLRKIDDLPLYEMTYHGSYDLEAPLGEEELAGRADGWACSLFALGGDRPLFGRNFDWDPNPALIVHADPPDGYASVSVVDLFHLIGGSAPPDLSAAPDRRRMAHAVLAPYDGVNEKGLAIGMATSPEGGLPARSPDRPDITSVRVIRMMLDKAATVDEALAIMRRYDVDFTIGPQIHYLIADAAGGSAVVEYAGGRLNVIDDRMLTNFGMTGTSAAQRRADHRYRTLAEGLPATRDWRDAMGLLRRVAQPHTRWSVVYDLTDATARVVAGQRWETVHTIPLVQR
ncbi:carcinine hydrolase/isopenicillin-N N-acyltransferase family protein [Streptosporangium sp. LJ11]|uniref:carcinine hydrolase/isopenicillin-N N-acyltransferase family protein n=1 Tax=Streptosporangium sp. LJ11 TaxID=3436927 RepID=UPI003F7900B5